MKNKIKRFTALMLIFTFMISAFTIQATAANTENIAKNDKVQVNLTDSNDTGNVAINYIGKFANKLKVQIILDKTTYSYDLKNDGSAELYPLQFGNGTYKIKVLAQASGNKYSLAFSTDFALKLTNDNAPFLNASQYVNYNKDSKVVAKAADLIKELKAEIKKKENKDREPTDIEKTQKIYSFIVKSITYDTDKAAKVQPGYLPSVDTILSSGKGICFDYAAVLASMLRSLGVPTKLVIGWVDKGKDDKVYHAWNEFYIKQIGWFKINEMKLEGNKFQRVDSTFDSSSKSSSAVIQFIGNGSNYATAYVY